MNQTITLTDISNNPVYVLTANIAYYIPYQFQDTDAHSIVVFNGDRELVVQENCDAIEGLIFIPHYEDAYEEYKALGLTQ